MNPKEIINFHCLDVIYPRRIVSYDVGADDRHVKQASSAAQPIAGVSEWGHSKALDCDVVMSGTAKVEFGGDIVGGDAVVSDSIGRAVKFDPAQFNAGDKVWLLGVSTESGDLGTMGVVTVNPQLIII